MATDTAHALVEELSAYDPVARQAASDGLVKLGAAAVPTIVDHGLRSLDPAVRWYAAQVLGDIGSSEAVMPLAIALADSDADVVQEAIRALNRIGDEGAIPLLEAFSSNPAYEDYLRDEARAAIGEIRSGDKRRLGETAAELGGQGDLEQLATLIKSTSDHDVRKRAVAELGRTGNPDAVGILVQLQESDANLIHAVSGALKELGPVAVEPLIGNLASDVFQTRLAAVLALDAIGDPRALPALEETARTDPDKDVRRAAATAASNLS